MNKISENKETLQELVNITAERLQLTQPSVVEKDFYVTQALLALSKISNENFELIFQGGTSLAKAHRIIQRMSEDCDFRMQLKSSMNLSKEKKRKTLRSFRHNLVATLRETGLNIADEDIRVRNEGQFMSIRARYNSIFPTATGIKPYLALEFFLANVKTQTATKQVTTLIRQTLGNKIIHPEFPINSVSVIETAAEKWVALTRRIATMKHRQHYRDPSLVRHLYDIHSIEQNGLFNNSFQPLVAEIVQNDREQYKNHNNDYYNNPIKEIERAIKVLGQNYEFKDNWNDFINYMVYAQQKPTYSEALATFTKRSQEALEVLDKINFS